MINFLHSAYVLIANIYDELVIKMSGGDQHLETSYGRVILKQQLKNSYKNSCDATSLPELDCSVSYVDKHISKMVTCLLNQRVKCVDY